MAARDYVEGIVLIVAVEGVDGSGKSTLCKLIISRLTELGIESSLLHWFGDEAYRTLAGCFRLGNCNTPEVLASIQICSAIPALQEDGKVQIWDRYKFSCYAASRVRGASVELMESVLSFLPAPDIAVLLEADVGQCFERAELRSGVSFFESGLDRLFVGNVRKGERAFEGGELRFDLKREVFVQTMLEWMEALTEVMPAETLVTRCKDLEELEAFGESLATIISNRTTGQSSLQRSPGEES